MRRLDKLCLLPNAQEVRSEELDIESSECPELSSSWFWGSDIGDAICLCATVSWL